MRRMGETGFTLLEAIVAAAVLAVIAAVLVLYITRYIGDSRVARARNETQVIGGAVTSFYKDTGMWPDRGADGKPVSYLFTGGASPEAAGIFTADPAVVPPVSPWVGTASPLDNSLLTNGAGNAYPAVGDMHWKGPYVSGALPADPWGHPYLVNRAASGPIWVVSAGANGKMQTAVADNVVRGDDIGFRLR